MTERELERRAQRRLAVLRHVEEVSGNVAATCRYYGISRQCYYNWLRRCEAESMRPPGRGGAPAFDGSQPSRAAGAVKPVAVSGVAGRSQARTYAVGLVVGDAGPPVHPSLPHGGEGVLEVRMKEHRDVGAIQVGVQQRERS